MASGYTVESNGDIALVAATVKTILMIINATSQPTRVVEMALSFDGVAAANEPVTVELVKSTQAGSGSPTIFPTFAAQSPELQKPSKSWQLAAWTS